jgi:hypothetical protein
VRSRARQLALVTATVLATWLLIEALAFGVLSVLEGAPFRPQSLQAARVELGAGAATEPDASPDTPPRHVENKFIHPYVGYIQDPTGRPPNVPGRKDLAVNRFGYVDTDEPLQRRGPDRFIVAIVGGSVARDFSLLGDSELAVRLRELPALADREIVFVRLALAGYKQPQQLMTIAYLLSLGAEFDAVINLDGFNEVALHFAENAKTQTFAAFPRHWYYQIVDVAFEVSGEYQYARVLRSKFAELFGFPPLRWSPVANLVWRQLDQRLAHDVYAAHEAMASAAPQRRRAAASGPERRYADDAAVLADLVAIWKRSSIQLDRLLRANGAVYLHVLHPNQYYPDTRDLSLELASAWTSDHKYRAGAVAGYPRLVEQGAQLRESGVAFLDLTRAFAGHDRPFYVDSCCHFNKWGHRLLAHAIADALADEIGEQPAQ